MDATEKKRAKYRKDAAAFRLRNPERAKQHTRDSYARNLDARRAGQMAQYHRAKAYVDNLKEAPCTDCRLWYPPYVMQFDHVRGKKLGAVSRFVSKGRSQAVLDAEIAKCELVCANCHAVRTYAQGAKKGGPRKVTPLPPLSHKRRDKGNE